MIVIARLNKLMRRIAINMLDWLGPGVCTLIRDERGEIVGYFIDSPRGGVFIPLPPAERLSLRRPIDRK